MEDVHLTRELLQAVFRGDRTPADLVPLVLGHLFSFCPTCEEAFRAWRGAHPEVPAFSHGEAVDRVLIQAVGILEQIDEEEPQARALTEEALSLPPEERLPLLEQAPLKARGPALAANLLEAARASLPGDPHESLTRARLARTLLQHAELTPYVAELYARAVAYVANGLRILGNLSEAAEMMAHARFLLRYEEGGDRAVKAELDNLEGLVRLYQREYPEAEALLKRAILGYRFAGLEREALSVGVDLAVAYRDSDDLDRSIETQRQVLEALEPWDEPQLELFARHNLAVFLCDAGEYAEVPELLEGNRAAIERSGSTVMLLHFTWAEGLLARGLGDLEAAESHFAAARHGYSRRELPFDAVLVSLDLAGVYLEQGRSEEVKALAAEAAQVFEGQERHTETLAALTLFRAAAELERVTQELIQELVGYLRRSFLDPNYRFRAVRGPSSPPPGALPVV